MGGSQETGAAGGGSQLPRKQMGERQEVAQLNRGGKSWQERGLAQQGQQGELAHSECPPGAQNPAYVVI